MNLIPNLDKQRRNLTSIGECWKNGCNGELIKKSGKYGFFFGCSNYPRCNVTRDYEFYPTIYGQKRPFGKSFSSARREGRYNKKSKKVKKRRKNKKR